MSEEVGRRLTDRSKSTIGHGNQSVTPKKQKPKLDKKVSTSTFGDAVGSKVEQKAHDVSGMDDNSAEYEGSQNSMFMNNAKFDMNLK